MNLDIVLLRNELKTHLGDQSLDDPTCDLLLNRSFWALLNKYPFKEKEKTFYFALIVGEPNYQVPTLFEAIRIISIEDLDSYEHVTLDRMSIFEYENEFANITSAQGKPIKYIRERDYIRLFPTPDKTYAMTLKCWITLADISDTDSDFPLPPNWFEILLYGAVQRGHMRTGNAAMATEFKNQQSTEISETVPIEAKENQDTHNAGVKVEGYNPNSIYDA